MLRGFRWQLVVLLTALGLFLAGLASRSLDDTPAPDIPAEPTPAASAEPIVSAAAGETPMPLPADENMPPLEFTEALVGSVQRLNPLLAGLNPADQDITALIFEGLTRTNEYGEPIPVLAAEWVISSDHLEYVVRLRQDVLWQDGAPFTADDVMYTVSLLQSPDFPGPAALGRFWRTVEVQRLGDHLVRFRLTQPLGTFLDMLRIGILPEHALRGTTAALIANHPFNLSPIGTGPYQIGALRSSDGSRIDIIDLQAAPVYRQRPEGQAGYAINRFRFRLYDTFEAALAALQNGEADGLMARNAQERLALVNSPGLNIHTQIEAALGVLIFNWVKDETAYFREQRVRLALMTGLDRAGIIERYLSGQAVRADSPLFPGSWAYTADLPWPQPDINAARALLENARPAVTSPEATEEAAGSRYQFRILVPDTPALVNLAQEIAAQWSPLGVQAAVEAAAPGDYQSRLDSGDFDAAIVELSLGGSADPDVYTFWDEGQYPDGLNYGGVNDRRISENLERARRDPSGINRAVHYHEFQRDFIERAVAIPLYYPLFTYATAARVGGVQLGFVGTPTDRFLTLRDWEIAPPGQ